MANSIPFCVKAEIFIIGLAPLSHNVTLSSWRESKKSESWWGLSTLAPTPDCIGSFLQWRGPLQCHSCCKNTPGQWSISESFSPPNPSFLGCLNLLKSFEKKNHKGKWFGRWNGQVRQSGAPRQAQITSLNKPGLGMKRKGGCSLSLMLWTRAFIKGVSGKW